MKYLIVLLLGLVIGGVITVFFLGIPRAQAIPGTRVQTPPPGGDPPSTAVIALNSGLLNEMVASIFRDLGPPSFQLSQMRENSQFGQIENVAFQSGCANTVTLAAQGEGAKTEVQFANGNIGAPLVFSGSYNVLGNCMQFKGWAQTTVQLSFDQAAQTLYGRVNVEGVNLEGVAPFANSFVTVFVRTAIDQKVNPLVILRPSQLQPMIPVSGSNGTVKAHVKDVRSEVQDGMLRLHITYDFNGEKGAPPPAG
jgi:hypothetical protein